MIAAQLRRTLHLRLQADVEVVMRVLAYSLGDLNDPPLRQSVRERSDDDVA